MCALEAAATQRKPEAHTGDWVVIRMMMLSQTRCNYRLTLKKKNDLNIKFATAELFGELLLQCGQLSLSVCDSSQVL